MDIKWAWVALTILLSIKTTTSSANEIYVYQVGNDNTFDITQEGENHSVTGLPFATQGIEGDRNSITIHQDGEEYHQVEGQIVGDDNTIDVYQGGAGKSNFAVGQIIGDDNSLKVYQGKHEDGTTDSTEAGDHTSYSVIIGNNNNMEVYQTDQATNCCTSAHFVGNVIYYGDNNDVKTVQRGKGGHYLDTATYGDDNTLDVLQRGNLNQHDGDIELWGDDHIVDVQQKDNGGHSITLDLTNSGGAYNVNTLQEGATAQTYSLTGICTNTNGCAVSVTQN